MKFGTNFTRVRLSGKYHSASPRAILLPLNLTLVKFIPNFTPTPAITYTYIYIVRETVRYVHLTLVVRTYIMWAELSVSHFCNSNHWKRALKIVFKGSGCFQFPEAVVTSTVKESLRFTDRGSLQVLVVL